jgi:hypothetical protein
MTFPIKVRKLYAQNLPMAEFTLAVEPLPASVTANWTEAQHIERREAERAAIDAEWMRLGRSPSGSDDR